MSLENNYLAKIMTIYIRCSSCVLRLYVWLDLHFSKAATICVKNLFSRYTLHFKKSTIKCFTTRKTVNVSMLQQKEALTDLDSDLVMAILWANYLASLGLDYLSAECGYIYIRVTVIIRINAQHIVGVPEMLTLTMTKCLLTFYLVKDTTLRILYLLIHVMLTEKCYYMHIYIYFLSWRCWVFVAAHGLSLVAGSGGYSSLRCTGFSMQWLLLLRSTGSRRAGFSSCGAWALEHRLSSCGTRA